MVLLEKMKCFPLEPVCCWLFVFSLVLHICNCSTDTLRAGQVMRADEALESSNQLCLLHFHTNRFSGVYLVISYESQYLWTANRDNPLINASEAALTITRYGELVITDDSNGASFIINSDQPPLPLSNYSSTSLKLLDSGNLVLQDGDKILWQSFDYMYNSDTLVPGMKLGQFRTVSGHLQNGYLNSWLGEESPRTGAFTFGVDPNSTKQLAILQRNDLYWRSGLWNEHQGFPFLSDFLDGIEFSYTSNEHKNESYFTFTVNADNISVWITMDSSGRLAKSISSIAKDSYMVTTHIECEQNGTRFGAEGCTVLEPSKCRSDEFSESEGTMSDWWTDSAFDLDYGLSDCKAICLRDCSCIAYVTAKIDGTGCKFSKGQYHWLGPGQGLEVFYLRASTAETLDPPFAQPSPGEESTSMKHPVKRPLWIIIGCSVLCFTLLVIGFTFCYTSRNRCSRGETRSTPKLPINEAVDDRQGLNQSNDHDLPFFSFSCVEMATNHFSSANKLGQGGFGTVYKGKLADGQEIAVKRLTRGSGQGMQEIKNEMKLISKLQHRNLVKLLGCCIEGDDKILIYEYMPNNSLDSFLFDVTKRALLDWKLRVCIIEGIAQGLLYLHKYSRLRIIHRDLKTSNVLLDENMNPKIGDFGTARIFSESESPARTKRIIGTYGYMSPEYAMDGIFSAKSDVFSFGVIMLEIISSRKNSSHQHGRHMNLVGHTWDLWKQGRTVELMDPVLGGTCLTGELVGFVQVALLCVQESAADRPTMYDVVSMISNGACVFPDPKQPALCNVLGPSLDDGNLCEGSMNLHRCSINKMTISDVEPR